MPTCYFVSDLHGVTLRYNKLFDAILRGKPDAVFLGGDLLPTGIETLRQQKDSANIFTRKILASGFTRLKNLLGNHYPKIFIILGNDDLRIEEPLFIEYESEGIWEYIHSKQTNFKQFSIYGYSFVPPTPFQLKDWEKYDISRYTDPNCVPPTEGWRSIHVPMNHIEHSTIKQDIDGIINDDDLDNAIFLFHSPPYQTNLDRVSTGKVIFDHSPLDPHVGSIAIRILIEDRQPLITLHGHIHESPRITGSWKDRIGRTRIFTAAHDGPELSLVSFNPLKPDSAERHLL
jgi:Icc-related predicted phosphoesterase